MTFLTWLLGDDVIREWSPRRVKSYEALTRKMEGRGEVMYLWSWQFRPSERTMFRATLQPQLRACESDQRGDDRAGSIL